MDGLQEKREYWTFKEEELDRNLGELAVERLRTCRKTDNYWMNIWINDSNPSY
jgi:hypothetical protein